MKGFIVYYTYEGSNEELNGYMNERKFSWYFEEDTSEFVIEKIENKTKYSKSFILNKDQEETKVQYDIASFVRKSIVDIECDILNDKLQREVFHKLQAYRSEIFYNVENLGVKPIANYSDKELLSWERDPSCASSSSFSSCCSHSGCKDNTGTNLWNYGYQGGY